VLGIAAIILLTAFGQPPDFGSITDPDLMAEFLQQFFKPERVTATLDADDDLSGEAFVESVDVASLVM
jgi:hypothetical protein